MSGIHKPSIMVGITMKLWNRKTTGKFKLEFQMQGVPRNMTVANDFKVVFDLRIYLGHSVVNNIVNKVT